MGTGFGRLGARARGHESVATAVLARLSLVVAEAPEVERVFELLFALPRASVSRYFDIAIEDARDRIGGHERERPKHELMRNRIVVGVEAKIRGFARVTRHDAYVSDARGPIVELSIEVIERMKGTRREERLAELSIRALDAPFSLPRALATGLGAK